MDKVILTKEDREKNLLVKFKSSISTSLENLNIRNLIDLNKENHDLNESLIDNDNISVASSKYMNNRSNVKLPFIIGTNEFFKNEFLGIFNEELINIPLGLKRNRNSENISLKNDVVENEFFNNHLKEETTKNNLMNNSVKLNNPFDNLVDLSVQLKKEEIPDNNIPHIEVNSNKPVQITEAKQPDNYDNLINVVPIANKEIENKTVTNDHNKPNVISLNQFITNPLFSNVEEEDSLFKTKIKTSVITDSRNMFETTNLDHKIQESEKPKDIEKIVPPTNLFTINEKDESKLDDEINNKKKNIEEKDESIKISEMKKKLNKFLVDIDNEESDIFGKQNKPIQNTFIEKKNDKFINNLTKKEENSVNLLDDPLSTFNKEDPNLFTIKKEPIITAKKEEVNEKLLPETNSNKNKKPYTFKSALLYDDDEEENLFKNKHKTTEKVPEEKSKIIFPPLIGILKNYKDFSFPSNETKDNKILDNNDDSSKPVKLPKKNTEFDPLSVFSDIDFNSKKENTTVPLHSSKVDIGSGIKNLFFDDKTETDTNTNTNININTSTKLLNEVNFLFENDKITDNSQAPNTIDINKNEIKKSEENEINQNKVSSSHNNNTVPLSVEEDKAKEDLREEQELFPRKSIKGESNPDKSDKKKEDEKFSEKTENPLENILKNIHSSLSGNTNNQRGSLKKEIKINFLEDDEDDPLSGPSKKQEVKKEKAPVPKKENKQISNKKEKKKDSSDEDDLFTKNLKKNEKNSVKLNLEESLKSRFSDIQQKLSENNNLIAPLQAKNESTNLNTESNTVKDAQSKNEDNYGDIIVNKLSLGGPKKSLKKKSTFKRFEVGSNNNQNTSDEKQNKIQDAGIHINTQSEEINFNSLKASDKTYTEDIVSRLENKLVTGNEISCNSENKILGPDSVNNLINHNLNVENQPQQLSVDSHSTEKIKQDSSYHIIQNEIDHTEKNNEEKTSTEIIQTINKSHEIIQFETRIEINKDTEYTSTISDNLPTINQEGTVKERKEIDNGITLEENSLKEKNDCSENTGNNKEKTNIKKEEENNEVVSDENPDINKNGSVTDNEKTLIDPIPSVNLEEQNKNGTVTENEKKLIDQIPSVNLEEQNNNENIKEIQAKIFSNIKAPQENEKKPLAKKITIAFDDDD